MKANRIGLAVLAGTLAMPISANGQDRQTTHIGNFLVTIEKDPFSDKDTVVALALSGTDALGLRCLESTLSLVIAGQGRTWTEGDSFNVKFRIDNKEIFDETGLAISSELVEVQDDAGKIMDDMNGGRSVAIRVTGAVSFYTFTVPLRQPDKAIALVKMACAK